MSWVRIGETSGYFTADASTRARCNVRKCEEARDSATNSWRPVTSIFSLLFKLLGRPFYVFDVHGDVRQPFKYYFEDFFSVNGGVTLNPTKLFSAKGGARGWVTPISAKFVSFGQKAPLLALLDLFLALFDPFITLFCTNLTFYPLWVEFVWDQSGVLSGKGGWHPKSSKFLGKRISC